MRVEVEAAGWKRVKPLHDTASRGCKVWQREAARRDSGGDCRLDSVRKTNFVYVLLVMAGKERQLSREKTDGRLEEFGAAP